MKFDELNQLKRYFAEMNIPESERKRRVEFADYIYDAVLYTLTMIRLEREIYDRMAKQGATVDSARDIFGESKESLQNRIYDAFDLADIPFEEDYIPQLVDDIVDVTKSHIDEDYFTSADRALIIAQNEANTAYNYADYVTAVDSGKQFKIWNSEGDRKVRLLHEEVDGMIVPIKEFFLVGKDMMLFPHDYLHGSPENLINCRCLCTYEY